MQKHNIRKYRLHRDFNQSTVAKYLGMSVSNYSKIERNELDITLSNFLKLATFFGVSLADLAGWEEIIVPEGSIELSERSWELYKQSRLLTCWHARKLARTGDAEGIKRYQELLDDVSHYFTIPMDQMETAIDANYEKLYPQKYRDAIKSMFPKSDY